MAVGSWTRRTESLCYKKLLESVTHVTTIYQRVVGEKEQAVTKREVVLKASAKFFLIIH